METRKRNESIVRIPDNNHDVREHQMFVMNTNGAHDDGAAVR